MPSWKKRQTNQKSNLKAPSSKARYSLCSRKSFSQCDLKIWGAALINGANYSSRHLILETFLKETLGLRKCRHLFFSLPSCNGCLKLSEKLLACCVWVNSCSLTLMTAVHFLHQTDIGLALRKHEAIYGITPTLFSPSLSFSPSPCLPLRSANKSAAVSVSLAPAKLVPFSSAASATWPDFSLSAGRHT